MTDLERVYVVIPCFDEGEIIYEVIGSLRENGYSVVVVDDGSSHPVKLLQSDSRVHLLRHEINLGQGAALQTGMEYAIARNADYIVHFDADGQHDVTAISEFLYTLHSDRLDIILGSRFLKEESLSHIPMIKKLVLRTARLVNWVFTGLYLTDAHNGFRVMTKEAAMKIKLTENRMAHATEIINIISAKKLRWKEMPVTVRYTDYSRAKGQSSLNAINIIIDLILNKLF